METVALRGLMVAQTMTLRGLTLVLSGLKTQTSENGEDKHTVRVIG